MKNLFLFFLIFSCSILFAASENYVPIQTASPFKVIQQTSQYVDVEFTLPSYKLQSEKVDGINFQKIITENAGQQLQPGMPDVPNYSINLAIPYHGSVTTEILGSENNRLTNFVPYPQQDLSTDAPTSFRINQSYYQSGGLYPQNKIQTSDPEILREMRIVNVTINPFSYNAGTKILSMDRKIHVRFHFTATKGANEMEPPTMISPSFEPIYKAQILNYGNDRDVALPYAQERILMIYPYTVDTTFMTRLNNLIDWKKQKGYLVTTEMLPSAPSNTSVKTIIQTAYDNISTRPTYVILIGDASGTFTIPTWMHAWSSYNGEGDYPYTLLAGSDLLGDLLIGRISISSTDDFLTMTGKGFLYERDLDMTTSSWLNKMLLVGDPSSSGVSTIYTNKYIKEISAVHNPSLTYTEVYAAPFSSQIDTGINVGTGIFHYRGYLGMSGWSPTASLVNSYKLPHAIIITCGTGTFTGASTTEALTRLGTDSTPKGTVTAIGMATVGTHTMLNNCLAGGIADGIYTYDMHTMGQALLNGKVYLHRIYHTPDPDLTEAFQHICNLMGDPTVEVFTGVPSEFSVRVPTTIPTGSNQIEIVVQNSLGNVVPDAIVTCYARDVIAVTGLTDAEGKFIASIPTTLTAPITVTVSKQNFKPSISTVTINSAGSLVFNSYAIDDDNIAPSSGNANGTANAGEIIELQLSVKNTTAAQITGVSGVLATTTTGCTVLTSSASFGSIAAGASANSTTKYLFRLLNSVPDNTPINFKLNCSDSGTGRYSFSFQIISRNGDMDVTNVSIPDGGNGVLDPGETTNLVLTIQNNGQIPTSAVYATLSTVSSLITINDASAYFGTINNGSTATCSSDPFNITGKVQLLPGMVIPMNLTFYNSLGYSETEAITLNIGVVHITDPTGPDAFGHFIYDSGDINYPDAPVYSWVEISPLAGGSGTQVAITDVGTTGDEGDQTNTTITTVTMPFTFRLYGRNYTTASICSNGFIGMGTSADGEFRNYTLPGALGPNPLIAAFWDDLSLPTGSGVYQYYNTTQHYWVVEWYLAKNGYNQTSEETFQAILYDPVYYPTNNGDGMIKLQYKVFNNIDIGSTGGYTPTHGNYATIGIKDHTGTDGIQYSFNNTYPISAATLGNNTALLITGTPESHTSAYLSISDKVLLDGNNGILEPNEDVQIGVSLMNMGLQTGHNVSATLSSADSYITVTTPTAGYADISANQSAWGLGYFQVHIASNCPNGYAIPMVLNVTCTEGTWQRYFTINVVKPGLVYENFFMNDQNGNNNGIPNANESILIVINTNNTGTVDVSNVNMTLGTSSPNVTLLDTAFSCGTSQAGTKLQKAFRVNLGTITDGTAISFNLGITGNNITSINQVLSVVVGTIGINTDFEVSNGNFTANVPDVLPGWQYGTTSKITENTSYLWGTDLTNTYPNFASWDLFSPAVNIGTNATLSFWHYYLVEANYDGGVVYISTDGGTNWSIITPNGGYPNSNIHLAVSPAYSCSYPTPTTGVSGTATFDLSAYAGQSVIFKWHFFSDQGVVNKGWFIDNVVVSGALTKTGRINGTITLSPTSPNVVNTVVKAGSYVAHPDTNGAYAIYLPNGTYTTSATLTSYSVPSTQSLTISDANPIQTGNFSLEFLAAPPTLTCYPIVGSIPLNWSARNDRLLHFIHYNVWRKINADSYRKIIETTNTSYNDTPTVNGTYSYYVTTDYTEGESGTSNVVTFAYPPAGTAPNPVTQVSPANAATGIAILPTFTWNAGARDGDIPGTTRKANKGEDLTRSSLNEIALELPADRDPATIYYVYCDTNADPTTLVGSPTTTSFTLTTPLSYSTVYKWKVVAHNTYGNSTGNTVRSFTTMSDPNPPNPVTLVSPTNGTTNVAKLPTVSWTPSVTGPSATVYYVYCGTNTNPTTLVGAPTTSPFTFTTPLGYSTTYYWKVVAHNANGSSTPNTVWSFTTLADTTPLPTPTNVSSAKTENGIEISWNAITGASVYRIYASQYLSTEDWGEPIVSVNAPTTSWIDTAGMMQRFYRVTADNVRIVTGK